VIILSKCSICGKSFGFGEDRYYDRNSKEICRSCFQEKYGEIILETKGGYYYGGHKAYPAGGFLSEEETGHMYLTKNYFIFIKPSFWGRAIKWGIWIPLEKVQLAGYDIRDEARRINLLGGGIGGELGAGLEGGLFGGTLHKSGKKHEIVLPYVDENGILQIPRFGVASIFGGAIKEWAKAIYERIVEIQKEKRSRITGKASEASEVASILDQIKKLGELRELGLITEEEFQEKKKKLLEKI